MTKILGLTAAAVLTAVAASAGERGQLTGEYVEARTAEVFAGGCIMNSEAETVGRQAVLAWKITSGSWDGVPLDGLTVVAAIAGERNLGMREMGGEGPGRVQAIIRIDARATAAQAAALVAVARALSHDLITDVVRVEMAPVRFATTTRFIEVSADDDVRLSVTKELDHDPSCGAMQWFQPFSTVTDAAMGTAEEHAFSGAGLGTKWSAPHKRSAFWGTFVY